MKSGVIVAVIAVLLVAGGAFALTRKSSNKTSPSPTTTTTTQPTQNSNDSTQTPATQQQTANPDNSTTITYGNDSFGPTTLTVKSGTTITIKNNSSRILQFDSNPHPEHTDNPELNVGTISPGQSKTLTVTKTGTFGYHNHLNPSDTGTLEVQ
jgi:plastocyanin